jgi:predicted permease
MNSLSGDLRYAFRRARNRIGFTAVAIISLGLGIGVNTAAFSLVNAILLRKTPLPQPDRVAEIFVTRDNQVAAPFSYPDYRDLRDQSAGVFRQVSVASFSVVSRDFGDHVQTITGELVNGDYFPLIGMTPRLGRLLGPEDDRIPGGHPVVVLSYDYWQGAFASDPAVVGKSLRLNGRMYDVVGVAPKGIEGLLPGLAPAIYVPIQMLNLIQPTTRDEMQARGNHSYFMRVRLADGQSFAGARQLLVRFTHDMQRLHPNEWSAHNALRLYPLTSVAVSPLIDGVVVPAAAALMAVVVLVLVVACANLASFLLAQARDRQREIAIRLALGATRRVLVRQLLVESIALAVIGGALGIALSTASLRLLLHANLPIPLPINLDVGLDARVLAFVIAASLAAGILFGLLPALQATRPNVIETIKHENAGARPGKRFTLRSGLVVAQTATSLLLLVTAALFLRSFAAQANVKPGFGSAPAGIVWMAVPNERYDTVRRAQAIDEIERRIRASSGVRHVGITGNILLNLLSENDRAINVDGHAPPAGERGWAIQYATADSGYFDAVGLSLVSGRTFNSTDRPRGHERVAVINETFAGKFWPRGDALGRTFHGVDSVEYRIVGIVKTTKIRSLGEAPQPFFFEPYAQSPTPDFFLVAAGQDGAGGAAIATRMAATLREVDPGFMIIQVKTMGQHLAAMVLPARLGAVAFALFAALALLLAMIGIYGVVQYAVARRSREVAIRLAVGARPDGIVRLLMGEGVRLVAVGAVIGIALSLVAARGLGALLYGVPGVDPVAFLGAPALLVLVGALAAFLPARKAIRVDPATTLRSEG